MSARRATAAGHLLLVMLLSTAVAAPGSGQFIVEGPMNLPPGTSFEGQPLGVFTDDAAALSSLTFTAAKARLYEMRQTFTVAHDGPPRDARVASPVETLRDIELTDVRLEMLSHDDIAWVGAYPSEGNAYARFESDAATAVQALETSSIGNGGKSLGPAIGVLETDGRRTDRHYHQSVLVPHVLVDAPGMLELTGKGMLKVLGLDLRLASNEQDLVLSTGHAVKDGAVRQEVYTWIFVEFEQATLHVDGDLSMTLSRPSVAWTGEATFMQARGELRTAEGTYAASGRSAALAGDFVAHLVPSLQADRLVTYVNLDGDLSATTLRAEAVESVAAPAGTPFPWLVLVGGLAMVGGAGAAVAVLARRREAAPPVVRVAVPAPARRVTAEDVLPVDDGLQADDCIRFADEAAVERRWARALHWARRARERAPTNARIRADEGEYLYQLGLFEEALHAFSEASRLDAEEGYADYRGAQASAAAGRPVDEVLGWLSRALEKSPDLVGDLELFKEFEGLRDMPAYETMVRRAYERLGIDPAHPY